MSLIHWFLLFFLSPDGSGADVSLWLAWSTPPPPPPLSKVIPFWSEHFWSPLLLLLLPKHHDWQWKVFPNDCIGQVRRGREGDSVEGSDRRLCVRVLGCKTWQLPIDGLDGSVHTIIIIILASWVRIGFEKVEDDEEDWRFNQVAIAQAEDWHGSHRQSTKLPSSFAAWWWWRSPSYHH